MPRWQRCIGGECVAGVCCDGHSGAQHHLGWYRPLPSVYYTPLRSLQLSSVLAGRLLSAPTGRPLGRLQEAAPWRNRRPLGDRNKFNRHFNIYQPFECLIQALTVCPGGGLHTQPRCVRCRATQPTRGISQ